MNAPPRTRQRLGVFYLLSRGQADRALAEVRRMTHGDRFKSLSCDRTFTSHYHVEHTLGFLREQRRQHTGGVPRGLEEPPFVRTFKAHGVDIVHLAECHVAHTPEFSAQRLPQLKALHAECRRLSDTRFLLLPGEEPNVCLGGHWISLFPRSVYRRRVDLSEHGAFGVTVLRLPVDLKGATWVRLAVWDVASSGAFSQPVWVEQREPSRPTGHAEQASLHRVAAPDQVGAPGPAWAGQPGRGHAGRPPE